MSYSNYEEYMRSILGYSPYNMQNNYTYQEPEDNYFIGGFPEDEQNVQVQDVTPFYPEIYKMVYPMVCKECNINMHRELTKELLEQMTDEIYSNIESEDEINVSVRAPLKNGDVRNPNSKDPEPIIKETRQSNYLLKDLIKILLLKEWGRPIRPPFRPQMGPNVRPPVPPPPSQRPGNRPQMPPQRPRYY